jgi:hypothetical protein
MTIPVSKFSWLDLPAEAQYNNYIAANTELEPQL